MNENYFTNGNWLQKEPSSQKYSSVNLSNKMRYGSAKTNKEN